MVQNKLRLTKNTKTKKQNSNNNNNNTCRIIKVKVNKNFKRALLFYLVRVLKLMQIFDKILTGCFYENHLVFL